MTGLPIPAPVILAPQHAERVPSSDAAPAGAGSLHGSTASSPWADDNLTKRLLAIWHGNSASQVAAILNSEFGVSLSRNAVIGKANRLGISGDSKTVRHNMQKREKKEHRTTLRLVSANGNSGQKRLVQSVTTDLPKLRCIAEPPLNLTLAEMRDDLCHYIGGEPEGGCYCGHPVREGIAYCLSHDLLMHDAPKPVKRSTYSRFAR